jgi:hypothetical protein
MRQVERDLLGSVAWVGEFQSRASHLATTILGPVVAAKQVRDRQQMRHLQRFVARGCAQGVLGKTIVTMAARREAVQLLVARGLWQRRRGEGHAESRLMAESPRRASA